MDAFDPYYRWLGIAPKDQPPDHYRLLAIDRFEPHADVISEAADRQMAHLRTHQAGPNAEAAARLLNEIALARVCLLNVAQRTQYDTALRAKLNLGKPAAESAQPSVAWRPSKVVVGTAVTALVLFAVAYFSIDRQPAGFNPTEEVSVAQGRAQPATGLPSSFSPLPQWAASRRRAVRQIAIQRVVAH